MGVALAAMPWYAWLVIAILGSGVLGLIFYILKNKITVSKDGLSYASTNNIYPSIERIEKQTLLANRSIIDSYKDIFVLKLHREFHLNLLEASGVTARMLYPLYDSIQKNHFTHIYSDPVKSKEWCKKIYNEIMENIGVLEIYCNVEFHLDSKMFRDYLLSSLKDIKYEIKNNIIDSCIHKIGVYETALKNTKQEFYMQLIDKNQRYISVLKSSIDLGE